MKRKLSLLLVSVAALAILSGCGTSQPTGILFTDINSPVSANNEVKVATSGKACSTSWFHLVGTGSASTDEAKKNGNITNVATVDYSAFNILGIYGKYCTTVTGN